MKRMQFIKGWRDLIILVALVQLTFMCPLCLGQNNPGAAAGSTNKKFVCTLDTALNASVTAEKVTIVVVTAKPRTVHDSAAAAGTPEKKSTIEIVEKFVNVKNLDECGGITGGDSCTVTYPDGNDTKTATGRTGACVEEAVTVLPGTPHPNTFRCTLTVKAENVTKVDVTTKKTVYDLNNSGTSGIEIDGAKEKITVKNLDECAGINDGDTCTVTYQYKDGTDTKTATGTPVCEAPDAATTPTTEASNTAGTGNVTTDATTTAAATQPEGTAAATQPEAKPNTKAPTKTTKKPTPDHKGDSSRRKTSIRLFVLLLFVSLTNI